VADPAARLYLNDYNIEGTGAKSNALFALAQSLLAQVGGLDELQRGQRRRVAEQQLAATLREEQATGARIVA